jgi:hypothetical protein
MVVPRKEPVKFKDILSGRVDYLSVALILSLIIIFFSLYPTHIHINPKAFEDNDNAELYWETKERVTVWQIFNPFYHSGRQGPQSYYYPMLYVIYGFMFKIFDTNPAPFYYMGLLLRLIDAVLVFFILKQIIKSKFNAFLASMSFAVFFPNLLSADYLVFNLSVGLLGFFYLMTFYSLILYFNQGTVKFYILSLVMFLFGVLTREWVPPLALILCAYYALLTRKRKLKPLWTDLLLLPYIVMAAAIVFIAYLRSSNSAIVNDWGGFNYGIHMAYRIMDFLNFLVSVVPVAHGIKVIIAYGLLLVLPIFFHFCKKDRTLLFLLLWLALSLIPFSISNFNDIYSLSRYLFLPSIPWFAMLYHLTSKMRESTHRLMVYSILISYTVVLNISLILMY